MCGWLCSTGVWKWVDINAIEWVVQWDEIVVEQEMLIILFA